MYRINLSQPDITRAEKEAVLSVLETPQLSLGPQLSAFETAVAKAAGVKYAVAVNSGTSALHLIIRALGIKEGDEVITTPFSFVASANCALYEKATPVFADIRPDTFNIDPSLIEKKITKKTKAILAVDVFSEPADWDALRKIAKRHNLFLIEDSAESLGSSYRGKRCGGFGQAGIFAFYPNKQITAGEGGAVVTDSKKIADFCRSSANQGRKVAGGKWLEHVRLGYNYRLDEMSCALGLAQLKRFEEILAKRSQVAAWYREKLGAVSGIEIPEPAPGVSRSWFVYVVLLDKKYAGAKRDRVIKDMAARGIQCSNYFTPIHLQPFYRNEFGYKKGDFPVAELIGSRTLALPFYNALREDEVALVARALAEIIRN
jgi:perosamine synthetase